MFNLAPSAFASNVTIERHTLTLELYRRVRCPTRKSVTAKVVYTGSPRGI